MARSTPFCWMLGCVMLLRMVAAQQPGSSHRHRERSGPVDGLARPERGAEHQLAAWCLAALFCAGAALGMINLVIDDALRDEVSRPFYGAVLGGCLLLALALLVRQHAGPALAGCLVLLGDATYVLLAWATSDPLRQAPPLMLLFCCFVAAWFLGARALAVHVLAVVAACWIALAGSYASTAALLVHVAISSATLDVATLGVFLLRRRVQRLLAVTQQMSSTDPLTGLANRRALVDQAPRIWRQARRDGQRVGVLVLDLDHFKRLNDEFGHAVGDAVLRGVGAALAASVRPPDVLARTGGEELVVLGLVADPSEARRLAERLRMAVKGSTVGHQHQVTVSIGVALAGPTDGEDPADSLWRLVDRADAAMYQAKQGGRDRVVVAGSAVVPFRHAGGMV